MSESSKAKRSAVVAIVRTALASRTPKWAIVGEPDAGLNASYPTPAAVVGYRSPIRTPAGPVEALHLRVTLMIGSAHATALDELDDAADAILEALKATELELALLGVTNLGPGDNGGQEVLAAIIDLDVDRRT